MAAFDWPLVVHWAEAEDSAILSSCLVARREPPGEEELRGRDMVGGVRWDLLGVGTVMATGEACADVLWEGWVDGQRLSSGRGFFGAVGEEVG